MLIQRWNHFCICSGSDEMRSAHTQPAIKFVPCMLSIFWMMILKLVVISRYSEHERKMITRWLSMHENWLLAGSACAKISYSLAEHARKLVTRWLSLHENHFGARAFLEFFLSSSCPPFLCPLLPSLSFVHFFVPSLFPSWLKMRFNVHVKTFKIWTLAEHTQKNCSVYCRPSVWGNRFRVCSASDETILTYAQPAMKSFWRMLSQRML